MARKARPREVITEKTCLSCGACCVAPNDQEGFCDLTQEDEIRLGSRFVRLHVLRTGSLDLFAGILDGRYVPPGVIETKWRTQRSGPFRGIEFNTCTALRGSVFHRTSCSIYEKRPRACREAVKPGNRVCRVIRREMEETKNSLV